MNTQQRLTKLEQLTSTQNTDLAGTVRITNNNDGTATIQIGGPSL